MNSFDNSANLDEIADRLALNGNEADKPKQLSALEKFRKSILDQTRDYSEPASIVNLVQYETVHAFLTRKSYSLWQGKQKSKKTTALAILVACMISQSASQDDIRFEAVCDGVILIFDNEQGESFAARTMKLILKMAGVVQSPRLIYCDLREFSPTERMEIIKAAIANTPNVILAIIDGVVDLMNDFMDAKEGHTTVTDILKLCSQFDIHIAGVLHQNKGVSKDARAHVGSISSQKCEREIMAEVDPDDRSESIIICKESRSLPFDDFNIRWGKGELPHIVQKRVFKRPADQKAIKPSAKLAKDYDDLFHREMISTLFTTTREPKYTELYRGIKVYMQEKGNAIGDNKAKDYVTWLHSNGYLISPEDSGLKHWSIKPV
jgi:hypothetical protein